MRGYKNFDGTPHPGDLKHRVEIGYTVNTVNENGYPDEKDVVVCTVWASATDAGNQHYRSDIKPGMWVRFRGEKWFISTLGEYSFQRKYLGLKASMQKGISG